MDMVCSPIGDAADSEHQSTSGSPQSQLLPDETLNRQYNEFPIPAAFDFVERLCPTGRAWEQPLRYP
jgi:hypothetical protein